MNKKIIKIAISVAMVLTMTACSTALSKDEIFFFGSRA